MQSMIIQPQREFLTVHHLKPSRLSVHHGDTSGTIMSLDQIVHVIGVYHVQDDRVMQRGQHVQLVHAVSQQQIQSVTHILSSDQAVWCPVPPVSFGQLPMWIWLVHGLWDMCLLPFRSQGRTTRLPDIPVFT